MSNYQGWLIKVGNYIIPTDKFIKFNSYSVFESVADLDSYRDSNGYLHRNALAHRSLKVEFETPPMLTDLDMAVLMANIRANYVKPAERKATVTVYNPESDSYITQDMYMPDITYSIYGNYGGRIHYNAIRLAFIGY